MSQSEAQTSKKGRASPRVGSPLYQFATLDPDAALPSTEPVPPGEEVTSVARLSALPFYSNYGDLKYPVRFPNPVDVRNRRDFLRGGSADLSRDPFETRILNNGLQIGYSWPREHAPRPPFFDFERVEGPEWLAEMMEKYFPGINPYPQLRLPAGSNNLWHEHFGALLMDLYDAEGLLAQNQELRTDHVMALIRWQMIDYTDIVFIIGTPLIHDQFPYPGFTWKKLRPQHRFIVMPVHVPRHWALGIYHRDTRRLGIVNTHPNVQKNNTQFPILRNVLVAYLKAGLPAEDLSGDLQVIRVGVTAQNSSTNCGWHVANYVAFFFRQNQGIGNWDFRDWMESVVGDNRPAGMPKEEAMVIIWMFAIRSELNGTGHPLRQPNNVPVISLDRYRKLKRNHGRLSQEEIIQRKLGSAIYMNQGTVTARLPTPAVIEALSERMNKIDLSRPIDHRTSRCHKLNVPLKENPMVIDMKVGAKEVLRLSKEKSLGIHKDLSKTPSPLVQFNGDWAVKEESDPDSDDNPFASKGKSTAPGPRTGSDQSSLAQPETFKLLKKEKSPSQGSADMMDIDNISKDVKGMMSREGSPVSRFSSPGVYRKLNKKNVMIESHNDWAQKFVDTTMARVWVPMPVIRNEHEGWGPIIYRWVEEQNNRIPSEDQIEARARRAQNRGNR